MLGLVGLAFLGLALLLPPLLSSPALREQLEESASRWVGGRVGYEGISAGFLPPSLQVSGVRVAGSADADEPVLSAEQLRLELDLWPLLSGRLQLGSLQLRGVQLQLVRSAGGFELPFAADSAPLVATPGAAPHVGEQPPAASAEAALPAALVLRSIAMQGARLRVVDRTLEPPGIWNFILDVRARLEALDAPIEIFADIEAVAGGSLQARGQLAQGGRLELRVEIDALALAAFEAYLGLEAAVAGSLSGLVQVEGPAREPDLLRADLRVSDASISLADLQLDGDFSGQVEVERPLARPQGRFELDAAPASIRYAGFLDKPPGVPARFSGRIVGDSEGRVGVDDLELKLRDFEARGVLRPGPRPQLELRAAPVDLSGWGALLPGLALFAPTGSVELQTLRVEGAPLALHGSVELRDVRLQRPERPALQISAELLLEGDVLRSRGARIHLGQQPVEVEMRVEDLFGTRHFQSVLRAEAVDSDALVQVLGGRSGVLSGPLFARGEFNGHLGEGVGIRESLEGWLDFEIEAGSLAGVSLLEAVFRRMNAPSALGAMALEAGRVFGGRDLQRFYGDRFERLGGRLRVEGGSLLVEPLRMVYRDYGAELRGSLDLSDLSLDTRGVLTLYEAIDAVIARNAGAVSGYTPTRRRVPLAAVTGRLDEPRVRLDPEQVSGFLAAYAADLYRGRMAEMLDRKLGPGAGQAVDQGLQVLRDILGGGRSPDAAPADR